MTRLTFSVMAASMGLFPSFRIFCWGNCVCLEWAASQWPHYLKSTLPRHLLIKFRCIFVADEFGNTSYLSGKILKKRLIYFYLFIYLLILLAGLFSVGRWSSTRNTSIPVYKRKVPTDIRNKALQASCICRLLTFIISSYKFSDQDVGTLIFGGSGHYRPHVYADCLPLSYLHI